MRSMCCPSRSLGTNFKTKIFKFSLFSGPYNQIVLYHTHYPFLSKIYLKFRRWNLFGEGSLRIVDSDNYGKHFPHTTIIASAWSVSYQPPSHSFRVSHCSWRTSCAFDNEVGDLIHKQFFFVCASIVVNALQKQWHGVEKVKRIDMHVLYIMYCQTPLLCIRHSTKRGLISKPITTLHEFCTRP